MFPCGRDSKEPGDGKAPLWKNWRKTVWDFETDFSVSDVWGVSLTRNQVVIDYDPRNETEDNADQLGRLFHQLGLGRQETFMTKTGSGGIHIYYAHPTGVALKAKVPGYPAIDIKTVGGYVIAAGSKCANGKTYSIRRHVPSTLLELPTSMLSLIHRTEEYSKHGDGYEDDGPATVLRFKQYAFNCKPESTYQHACEGRAYGLSPDVCADILLDMYNPRRPTPMSDSDLRATVAHAYAYGKTPQGGLHPSVDFRDIEPVVTPDLTPPENKGAARKANYEIKWDIPVPGAAKLTPTLGNCVNYFMLPKLDWHEGNPLKDLVRFNQFGETIEFTRKAPWHDGAMPKEWSDLDTIELKLYLSNKGHYNAGTSMYWEAAVSVARMDSYHPVREYLLPLVWDGKPRIDDWLVDYAGAPDTPYVREVGKNTLIAAVARVLNPGCKHDSMLVLEGRQDIGKSTLVAVLGGDWYADVKVQVDNQAAIKETVSGMMGGWILEASEMELTRRADVNAVKRFLTVLSDKVRPAYERLSRPFPRQSIFIGTVNPEEDNGYLRDTTGNRRFWPVVVTNLKLDKLKEDRDQLFAEALHRYKHGEKWWITSDTIKMEAKTEAQKRMQVDLWSEIINNWYHRQIDTLPEIITTEMIAAGALNMSPNQLHQQEQRRLIQAIRAAGFDSVLKWSVADRKSYRTWTRDTISSEHELSSNAGEARAELNQLPDDV